MEINFEEYLTLEERKEIVADVFKNQCKKDLEDGSQRILVNSSYRIVQEMVNEIFDGELNKILVDNTKRVINGLSEYTVFKASTVYSEEGPGSKYLEEVLKESKPLIQKRISTIIDGFDEEVLRDIIKENAIELLDAKLFGKAA